MIRTILTLNDIKHWTVGRVKRWANGPMDTALDAAGRRYVFDKNGNVQCGVTMGTIRYYFDGRYPYREFIPDSFRRY